VSFASADIVAQHSRHTQQMSLKRLCFIANPKTEKKKLTARLLCLHNKHFKMQKQTNRSVTKINCKIKQQKKKTTKTTTLEKQQKYYH
jgi:hypothetical protein